ncbi:hypothetical protein MVEN_01676100 [Mycena venus]|uniref:Uncharacterized protein n=1 Tax=Mycena venus TaxID=2733690 RepID=A0A8H6XNP8_9AGAR|nr:hypothetical protein MVEN_01676100 [Mycena venus]
MSQALSDAPPAKRQRTDSESSKIFGTTMAALYSKRNRNNFVFIGAFSARVPSPFEICEGFLSLRKSSSSKDAQLLNYMTRPPMSNTSLMRYTINSSSPRRASLFHSSRQS